MFNRIEVIIETLLAMSIPPAISESVLYQKDRCPKLLLDPLRQTYILSKDKWLHVQF